MDNVADSTLSTSAPHTPPPPPRLHLGHGWVSLQYDSVAQCPLPLPVLCSKKLGGGREIAMGLAVDAVLLKAGSSANIGYVYWWCHINFGSVGVTLGGEDAIRPAIWVGALVVSH